MAERIKGLQIDLSLNDMGISKKLADVKREFRSLNTSMKTSSNNFKYGDKSAKSYKDRMSELQGAVEGSSKRLDTLKKRHAEVVEAEGAGSKSALRYADEINREADTLNMYRDQLNRVTQGYRENFSVAGKLSKGFSSIGNGFKAVGTKAQSVGASLSSKITKPAVVAGTAMAGITAKMGFDRLKGLDTAKAKLEGLGYSGKEVKSITDQVTEAVKGGMTTLGEGTDIAAGALAAGVKEGKDLKKYIQLVGDAAAGANRPVGEMATIFNRVQGQGKLMTEELNSIEDGMPGFSNAMAKHLGVSMEEFRKMVTEGEVSSDEFLTVMDDFAGGMAESYSKSFEGMVQNTKAYIGQIGQGFLSGVFQQAKGSLKEFEDLLSSKKVQDWATNAGKSLASGVNIMADKISDLVDWWKGLDSSTQKTLGGIAKWSAITLVAIGPMLTMFGKLSGAIGGMFGTFGKITGAIGKLGFAIKDAGSVMGGLASAFPKLGAVIGALTGPVGITVAIIGALVAAFVVAYKKSETFRNIVNGAFNAVKDTLSNVWNNVLKPVLTDLGNFFSQIWTKIKNAADVILPDLQSGFSQAFGVIKGVVSDLQPIFTAVFNYIKDVVNTVLPGIKSMFSNTFSGIKNIVSGAFDIILGVAKVFAGLFSGNFSHMWDGIKQIFSGAINVIKGVFKLSFVGQIVAFTKGMWKQLKAAFTNMWNGIVNIFNSLKAGVIAIWNALKSTVVNTAVALWNGIKKVFNTLKNGAINIFNAVKAGIVKIWNAIKNTVINIVKAWWSNVKNNFNSMKSGITNIFNAVKNTVVKIWTTIKSKVSGLVGGMKKSVVGTVGKMRDGIKGIVDKIKGYFTGMVTAVKKGLNKLIDGVNWVGGKLGMKKLGKIKLSTGTEDTTTHNVVTNGKINRDTFATVGDKGKGNGPRGFRQEMIRYPNGKFAITPNKDTTAYLPKGSSVFNGQQTYNAMHGLPQFAGGTWDKIKGAASNAWSKTKETVGKGASWLKNKVGDIMDFASHPGKLLDHVLKAFGVNFDFIKGSLPKDLMKGMFKKLKQAVKDLFTRWFDEAGGGEFDGSMGAHGVYKYLWDIAKKVMAKFPGMTYQSGYRPGDKYYHGKHQAVDIAYNSGMNGSSKYFKPANWVFDNFKKQIGYVITQGKIKTRGKFNHLGSKANGWSTWMDHDHYDHLHINGMWGPGDIAKNPGGKGVQRWRSYVQKALKKNGLSASKSNVNAWLSQINTESKGNPNAVQGYIPGDPNNGNPARGLLQTIPSTFKAHAFKGHKNIMNGYDNILAAIHYAKSRYGKNGMYQVIGHGHGYATGGLINNSGLYNLAEGGFPEFVIPTDPSKQSDAMKLLAIASQQISKKDKNKRPNQMRVPGGSSTQQDKENRELNQKLNTLISMFGQLLGLNNAQLQAIKDGAFDKSKMYNQMALDQSMADAQSIGG